MGGVGGEGGEGKGGRGKERQRQEWFVRSVLWLVLAVAAVRPARVARPDDRGGRDLRRTMPDDRGDRELRRTRPDDRDLRCARPSGRCSPRRHDVFCLRRVFSGTFFFACFSCCSQPLSFPLL